MGIEKMRRTNLGRGSLDTPQLGDLLTDLPSDERAVAA